MQFIISCILASAQIASAVYATETDYFTQYIYEQINVLADSNGVPYSTVTVSGTAASTPAATTTSTSLPASTSAAAAPPSSHSHGSTENYNYITAAATTTSSSSSIFSSSSSYTTNAPAAVTTTTSDSAPWTTSSTSSTSSTSPAPAPTTASSTSSSAAPAATTSAASGSSQFSGDATFYEVGLGACGFTNSDSELVAALNWEQWDQFGSMSNGNPACNKKATLNYGGKSVTVTIVDKCMGCKYGDLDLSPTAFEALADESVGRFKMDWSFN